MTSSTQETSSALIASAQSATKNENPYKYWLLEDCAPTEMATYFDKLSLGGDQGAADGRRELRNNSRKYFDSESRSKSVLIENFTNALVDPSVINVFETVFSTNLQGSYLRIEFAEDRDGFWLEPHTDLGVKLFTMLLYTSFDPAHRDLGTDIYDSEKRHTGRAPFLPNSAMVFVPSDLTYHGFEKRPISGVRKSVIINYVTEDWRAREQLAFPNSPISTRA